MPILARLAPWLLALAVLAVYGPSTAGGFLNYDDDVLVHENVLVQRGGLDTLVVIWLDLSQETRLALGAEYLPIRDSSVWLQVMLFGQSPTALRLANVAVYLAAVMAFRTFFRRTIAHPVGAELAAWVFALHPVHAESVAWISGHKDVLAMAWVGAALAVYAGRSGARPWLVPILLLAAHLSKSMTVVAGVLLLTVDLLRRARPDARVLGGVGIVAVSAFALHWHVGQSVGMVQPPIGGSRTVAAMTMGSVWLGYLRQLLWPDALSVVHDVRVADAWTATSVLGWSLVMGGLAAGLTLWRRGRPRLLVLWMWVFVPLLPVSQVLVPLQNVMADRYAFLSVTAVAFGAGWLTSAGRAAPFVVAAAAAALGLVTVRRAHAFSDSLVLFTDAAAKAPAHALPPFQIGMVHETAGDFARAEQAYLEAIARGRPADPACRAVNNVARIYYRAGDLGSAERALRRGLGICPDNEKVRRNLDKVLETRRRLGTRAR